MKCLMGKFAGTLILGNLLLGGCVNNQNEIVTVK